MSEPTGRRFCPVCGDETNAQFCPNDRTPTVVSQGFAKHPRSYEVGDIVAGRYQITGALGAGGFAAVYSAEHMGTAQEVAVKLMAFDMAGANGEIAVRRFFREARTTAALKHPNTVRVFDVGQDEQGPLFIAMEVLRGESLEDLMKRRFSEGRQLSEKETLDIAIQTLASLNEAHEKGLVHRDLKPGNIYLAESETGPTIVKVLDFGIARTADSSLTIGGNMPGTPPFMSPEQCRGEDLDGRSDLYSLAVLMFLSVCGRLPFSDRNMLKLMRMHSFDPPPDPRSYDGVIVSDELATVILRTLAKQPTDRPETAAVMRDALEALRRGRFGDSGMMIIPPVDVSGEQEGISTIDLLDEPTKESASIPRPAIDPSTIDIDFDDDTGEEDRVAAATRGARPHYTAENARISSPETKSTSTSNADLTHPEGAPSGMDVAAAAPRPATLTAHTSNVSGEMDVFGETRAATAAARTSSPATAKPTPAAETTPPSASVSVTPDPAAIAATSSVTTTGETGAAKTSQQPSGSSPMVWVLLLAIVVGGIAAGVLIGGGSDDAAQAAVEATKRAATEKAEAGAKAAKDKVNLKAQVAAEMARQETDPAKKLKHARHAVELDPGNATYKALLDEALKAVEAAGTAKAKNAPEPAPAVDSPPTGQAKPAPAPPAGKRTKRATRHVGKPAASSGGAKPSGDKPPPRRVKPAILEE